METHNEKRVRRGFLMSCGEREKRARSTMDTRLLKKMYRKGQTVRCEICGHLNGKTAKNCWICGEPIKKEAQP
jgi:rubrerythrin